ncbi:MAG: efflux transporter outer membrane subunit, partial [Desulfobacteraceae bacterium]
RQARALSTQNRSSFFPSIDASGSLQTSKGSQNTGSDQQRDLYTVGFDAGWEIDLFGKVKRSVEAAEADFAAQVENLNDVKVTLCAEVAINYIELRTYQAQLAVSEKNMNSMQATLDLFTALYQAGEEDQLAVEQARYNLESTRAKTFDFMVSKEAALNRLALLVGKPAGALHDKLSQLEPIPQASVQLAIGVPADVLRRRPDIRNAERKLAAETARIGETKANLYPSFSLSGSIGLEALSFGKLWQSNSHTWGFGPTISWPIFDAGTIRSAVNVQEEVQKQALIAYEKSILSALEEVNNALFDYVKEQEKLSVLQKAVSSAQEAAKLAQDQYETGMIGFDEVLENQQFLFTLEDQLAESEGAVVVKLVSLYKTLGGGWQSMAI